MTPYVARPLRTEAQAVADRIQQRLTMHIATMIKAGALEYEIAAELVALINAECAVARTNIKVVS